MKPSRAFSPRPTLLLGLAAILVGCGGGGGDKGTSSPSTPQITSQPQSVAVSPGQTVTLSVTARGRGTLAYQWFRIVNGLRQGISGATNSTLTLTNLSSTNTGLFQVLVESDNGNQTYSDVVAVQLDGSAPVITTPPSDRTAALGSAVAFTVVAAASPTPTYQWYKNGAPIGGATQPVYRIASVAAGDVASYTVTVTNKNGSSTSDPAALTLIAAPVITTQPVSKEVNDGQAATFSVIATGGDLSYQWFRGSAQIPRATSSTYTIDAASSNNAGTYTVRVTNNAGSVVSSGATLVVHAPPTITTQPVAPINQPVLNGTSVTLSVAATGEGSLAYQWFQTSASGTVQVSGATSSSYTFAAPASGTYNYYVIVTNAFGATSSTVVKLVTR